MSKILTPTELAMKFVAIEETSPDAQKAAATQLVTLITQVSKVRLQEVFDLLKEMVSGRDGEEHKVVGADEIKDLCKKYQDNGALFGELVNLAKKK